jgi:hypothetical protein
MLFWYAMLRETYIFKQPIHCIRRHGETRYMCRGVVYQFIYHENDKKENWIRSTFHIYVLEGDKMFLIPSFYDDNMTQK